jgi:hypothetical protein
MVATLVDEVRSESRQANIACRKCSKEVAKVEKKVRNFGKPAQMKKKE